MGPQRARRNEPTAGFTDVSPAEGMSGGAITDVRCGVLGITELQSAYGQGGRFVRLAPHILEWATLAAAEGAV